MAAAAPENLYAPEPTKARDMGPVISAIKEGTTMTRFYSKANRRPDQRTFSLKLEEYQIVWCRTPGREEGAIDIREIKEIRRGTGSKDFEKHPDHLRRVDPNCCIVLMYGMEFKLKTLSCVAQNTNEREYWAEGLLFLMYMYQNLFITQPAIPLRWLRKEWHQLLTASRRTDKITMREVRTFLQRANTRMPNSKLRDYFQSADRDKDGQIDFEGFTQLYENIMNVKEVASHFFDYIKDKIYVPLSNFQKFLMYEQEEPGAQDIKTVREYMFKYLADSTRRTTEPYFTVSEFLDYLFSKVNSIFNEAHSLVYQDMTKPMSFYWISSSHNTYLTGDQFSSESSVEAYIRCLRMGCRCLELDCWDGPDNQPIIYHGHTLTSKIKFLDVVRVIQEHAFAASEFPLILSLENHCSLQQQKFMAQAFKDIFGEHLLTQPVYSDASMLPSPMELKRKIILKHKKLPKDPSKQVFTKDNAADDELAQSLKNGILLLEDELDHEWHPHFFVLTRNKLFWSEEQSKGDDDDDGDSWDPLGLGETPKDELHYTEKWFHGKLKNGRDAGTKLLDQYNRGDGSFLVRESGTFVGDYTLSFWRQGKVQHCRIKTKQENGQKKYYLVDNVTFDSLYSMIHHYQNTALKSAGFEMTLTEAIPQPNAHLEKDWFHASLRRNEAEDMLKRVRQDGAFLVRKSETEEDSYAISFRAEGKIKHCRIKGEGRLLTIGTAQFESLVELVEYYEKHPLYRKMRLKYPINEEILQRIGQAPDEDAIYDAGSLYHEPNQFITKPSCRALWDYEAQKLDEMSFCKGAFITNVVKEDGGWWRGDYGQYIQAFFPANYCEEINMVGDEEAETRNETDHYERDKPLGDLQKGFLDVWKCTTEVLSPRGNMRLILRITPLNQKPIDVAMETEEELNEWLKCIHEASNMAEEEAAKTKRMVHDNNISKELSDLVIYCQPIPFDYENMENGKCYEMSSFPETRVEKLVSKRYSQAYVKYNRRQFSRVYPKGSRVDSSNYDPMPMWNSGVQMCALNCQTPDRAMQLNNGKFLDNGNCGYVLQPDCMRLESFDPYTKKVIADAVEPWTITITIIGARHLVKSGRGVASPFVEIEIAGASYDCNKYKTGTIVDNGLNPCWNDKVELDVINPPLALIRFLVQDEDMFGDPNFIGQAVYPLTSLKTGYRCIPLQNSYSEELELSTLLVHIHIENAMGDDENLYTSIQVLRDRMQDLSMMMKQEARKTAEIASMSNLPGPSGAEAQKYLVEHQKLLKGYDNEFWTAQVELERLMKDRAAKNAQKSGPRSHRQPSDSSAERGSRGSSNRSSMRI